MDKQIEKLKDYVEKSNNIVFFGGAGVSTESGIPDFRGKNGLYNKRDAQFEKYEPEYLLSRYCLYNNPKVFYEFYRQKMNTRNIEPNIVHYTLAKLEEKGKLKAIITQNIDGLHQKAGSKNVIELHGTTSKNYCSKCRKLYASDYIYNSKEPIPTCSCRGLIRPDITLYGEVLPQKAFSNALEAIGNADMLIIAGTSLTVEPAASLIRYFKGKHMVIINKEKIGLYFLDEDNYMFIESNVGDVFAKLVD